MRSFNHEVCVTSDILDFKATKDAKFDFLISYGYTHIIKQEIINLFPKSAVNLHISFLPFNRGSDPNFWSFIENSKKGVSIHYINAGLDKGEIIAQKEIFFDIDKETFASSYLRLKSEIETLFMSIWHQIEQKTCHSIAQTQKGSYHKTIDKQKYLPYLTQGYNTNIKEFLCKINSKFN